MNRLLLAFSFLVLLAGCSTELSIQQKNYLANETLVSIGDFCSGTVIDKVKRLIVTANHCAENTKQSVRVNQDEVMKRARQYKNVYEKVTIRQPKYDLEGNRTALLIYEGIVIGVDEKNDVAIIKVTTPGTTFKEEIKLSTTPVLMNDKIYTVGNPLMIYQMIAPGWIIKPKVDKDLQSGRIPEDVIIFWGFMAPGSSGGGLYNSNGELIGITNWAHDGGPYLASPIHNVISLLNKLRIANAD